MNKTLNSSSAYLIWGTMAALWLFVTMFISAVCTAPNPMKTITDEISDNQSGIFIEDIAEMSKKFVSGAMTYVEKARGDGLTIIDFEDMHTSMSLSYEKFAIYLSESGQYEIKNNNDLITKKILQVTRLVQKNLDINNFLQLISDPDDGLATDNARLVVAMSQLKHLCYNITQTVHKELLTAQTGSEVEKAVENILALMGAAMGAAKTISSTAIDAEKLVSQGSPVIKEVSRELDSQPATDVPQRERRQAHLSSFHGRGGNTTPL